MTLQEVSDGGLQIGVEAFGPTVHWTGDISKSQELKDQTNKAVADCHQNLLAVTTRLRNSLQGQERFYFPVSTVLPYAFFDYQNSTFSLLNSSEITVSRDLFLQEPDFQSPRGFAFRDLVQ